MSSFGALIVSNRLAPPQRELLLIHCYWEYECKWSIESISSLKVEHLLLLYWVLGIVACWRDMLRLLPWLIETEWKQMFILIEWMSAYCLMLLRHTTQVLHLWKWNKQCLLLLLSAVSAFSIIASCSSIQIIEDPDWWHQMTIFKYLLLSIACSYLI